MESGDELGGHRDDVADEADVDRLAVDDGIPPLGGEYVRVLAGKSDGMRAVRVDESDDVPLHLSGEHHPHNVHRLWRRDAQPAAELGLDAQPVEHRRDLGAAAVHDDHPDAGQAQEDDVLCEGRTQRLVAHRMTAVLHHDRAAVERLQPRQRLGEDERLGERPRVPPRRRGRRAHDE